METLEALAVRCESAAGPDRALAKDIYRALFELPAMSDSSYGWREDGSGWWCETGEDQRCPRQRIDPPNWLGSIDAAMTLVPADWKTERHYEGEHGLYYWTLAKREPVYSTGAGGMVTPHIHGDAKTPALALTAAALRAHLLAQKDHTPS